MLLNTLFVKYFDLEDFLLWMTTDLEFTAFKVVGTLRERKSKACETFGVFL